MAPEKSGDERSPAGQKRRQWPERLAQIDVLAAGIEAAARPAPRTPSRPANENAPPSSQTSSIAARVADELRDENRHEENAAADDVGDDDGRRIEGAEPTLERGDEVRAVTRDACGVIW